MTAPLTVVLETAALERVAAEVAVASLFETDRPLRGGAGRADWRLCGMLSELVASGRVAGAVGEALLVPTEGRMRAGRLLVLGLGPPTPFGAEQVAAASRDATGRLLDLGVRDAVLGLPGEWTGILPVRPAAEAAVAGMAEALDRAAAPLSLRLLVPAASAGRAFRGLEAAAATARRGGLSIAVVDAEAGARATLVRASGPRPDSRASDRP